METNSQYTVDYFIRKFETIPEDEWCVDYFSHTDKTPIKVKKKLLGFIPYSSTEYKIKDTFCAQGHCMGEKLIDYVGKKRRTIPFLKIAESHPEWNALIKLFGVRGKGKVIIASINNGDDPEYQQTTPRQRVLKALYDLKERQMSLTQGSTPVQKIIKEKELILN